MPTRTSSPSDGTDQVPMHARCHARCASLAQREVKRWPHRVGWRGRWREDARSAPHTTLQVHDGYESLSGHVLLVVLLLEIQVAFEAAHHLVINLALVPQGDQRRALAADHFPTQRQCGGPGIYVPLAVGTVVVVPTAVRWDGKAVQLLLQVGALIRDDRLG